jgi:hypothetical protein
MLLLLAAAQIDRRVAAILDMQADSVFVELATRIQIHHVKDGVAASDDVEGRIEDVLRNGHVLCSLGLREVRLHLSLRERSAPTGCAKCAPDDRLRAG